MDGGISILEERTVLQEKRPPVSMEAAFSDPVLEGSDLAILHLHAAATYIAAVGCGYPGINSPDITGFTSIMGRKPYEDLLAAIQDAALIEIRMFALGARSILKEEIFRVAFERLLDAAVLVSREAGIQDFPESQALRISAETHQVLKSAAERLGALMARSIAQYRATRQKGDGGDPMGGERRSSPGRVTAGFSS